MAVQGLSEPFEPIERQPSLAKLEMAYLLIARASQFGQLDQREPLGLPELSEPIIHAIDRRKPTNVERERPVFARR